MPFLYECLKAAWLQQIKDLELADLLAYYEPLALGQREDDADALTADTVINTFLGNANKQVLLIQGGSGSGKTLLGQRLTEQLLSEPTPSYLPVWVPLAAQRKLHDEFLDKYINKKILKNI